MKSPYTASVHREVSTARGTMGTIYLNDEGCHVCRWHPDDLTGFVRLNLDGIWTVLCPDCRALLIRFLKNPAPAEVRT